MRTKGFVRFSIGSEQLERKLKNSINSFIKQKTDGKKYQSIEIGVFDKEIAKYAYWNEYGNSHIPARSFFRPAIKNNKTLWMQGFKESLKTMSNKRALNALSKRMINDIKVQIDFRSMLYSTLKPNALSTIRKKGRNQPLIDTGAMREAITARKVE